MRQSPTCVLAALVAAATLIASGPTQAEDDDATIVQACLDVFGRGLRAIAEQRTDRFLGKVSEAHARCWGGAKAVSHRATPWVDWSNYWGAGDLNSKSERRDTGFHILDRNQRGIDGALINLEYQRMELIKFNLFDNRTFEQYLTGGGRARDGSTLKFWPEMRLSTDHPNFRDLAVAADDTQRCQGQLVRHRTLTGICNDINNPAMGSTGQLFGRNVEFEVDLSGSRARSAREEPAWRTDRAADP